MNWRSRGLITLVIFILVIIVAGTGLFFWLSGSSSRQQPSVTRTPTPAQPLKLEVKPSSIVASDPNICPNGKCEMILSSPNSDTLNIAWKATITIRLGAGTGIIGSVSPLSGTLAPGQTITVSFIISSYICGDITGSTITFTGGVSPVVVQLSGSFGPC